MTAWAHMGGLVSIRRTWLVLFVTCFSWCQLMKAVVSMSEVSQKTRTGASSRQGAVLQMDLAASIWNASMTPGVHAGSKQQLMQMWEARQVIQFAEFYPVGHRSTDYPKFFNSSAPYAVKFKTGYEPYILVSRKAMPWYDERFRGYGWDKVSIYLPWKLSLTHAWLGLLQLNKSSHLAAFALGFLVAATEAC